MINFQNTVGIVIGLGRLRIGIKRFPVVKFPIQLLVLSSVQPELEDLRKIHYIYIVGIHPN